jgi:hypothetical protein
MKNTLSYIFYTVVLTVTLPLLPLVALLDVITGGALTNKLFGHPAHS